MRVKVQYTTQLKVALGIAQEEISATDIATLPQLLAHLAASHGDAFTHQVLDRHGQLLPAIIVCLDDQQVDVSDDVLLRDGVTVTLLSAISGG